MWQGFRWSNYEIKLLAAALMLVDHIGALFFPSIAILRVVGRLSFPLFAWLLVQGEAHTRHFWQYAFRLLALGLLSQPIYQVVFQSQYFNILLMLLIGLLCLRLARGMAAWQVLVWLLGAVVAEMTMAEYGAYGIAVVALIRLFRSSWLWLAGWVGLHLLVLALPGFGVFQFPAVLSPLIFQLASGERGAKARWFYLFYPVHLVILGGIYYNL